MAEFDLNSPNAYHIRDKHSIRVCNLAGIKLAGEQRLKLENLQRGLNQSLAEFEVEKKRAEFGVRALMVARFTRASCDAFIGIAAALSEAVLPEGVAKEAGAVKGAYKTETAYIDSGGDLLKTATTAAKEFGSGMDDKALGFVVNSGAIKAEMARSALNSDKEGLEKSAAEYFIELGKFTLDSLERKKQKAFVDIAKEAFEYNEKVGAAFDELLDSQLENSERFERSKATLKMQARKISSKINDLDDFIQSCEGLEIPQT